MRQEHREVMRHRRRGGGGGGPVIMTDRKSGKSGERGGREGGPLSSNHGWGEKVDGIKGG